MSKRLVLGGMPEGHDVLLHPTAFAGWVGLFVTMINLVPWGQLDGGHIAYALIGPLQNRVARWVRTGLLLVFGYNLARFASPVLLGTSDMPLALAIGNSMPWLVWCLLLGLMGRLLGREHPACEPGRLSPGRRRIAVGCLLLFVLLFMPTPMTSGYRSPEERQVDAGLGEGNLPRSAWRTTSGA
jgi:membrane-associated protease RseP (regulator of RpoE activity)